VPETLHAIIGTAGHIDHGKTALVKALTGADTDRLPEEKARGISIDLGFAALTMGARRVGIVDVPGHERFIRNMLAGAHGIDLVLLTVAADDGVMPQTEEHLDIVHLLGVARGVIAVTKADLASPARLAEVRGEIEILVAGTCLEGASVVPVSVVTGAGLPALLAAIEQQLATLEAAPPRGRFRLPVDRAFVLKGHGVVVTGTALAGTVTAGAEVRVLPGGARARVRSVEVHGESVEAAGWRQRVALNLAGAECAAIVRGDVVADPAVTIVSERFDARVEVRSAARKGLRDHARVRVHLGTAEAAARLVLLDGATVLAPKGVGYAQVVAAHPLVALRGDRFVIRSENAAVTLGGGEVVLPVAERHRQRDAALAAQLEVVRCGPLAEAVAVVLALSAELALSLAVLAELLNRDEAAVATALATAGAVRFADGTGTEVYTTAGKWEAVRRAVVTSVVSFHARSPLARGVEMEVVRTALPVVVSAKLFRALVERLVAAGAVARHDSLLAAPDHRVALAGDDETLASGALAALRAAGMTPPDVRALGAALGVAGPRLLAVLGVLETRGEVARVSPDLYYAAAAVARARDALERHLAAHPGISAAEFRDALDVSRKFSIALLDYFDRSGVTLRVGDVRKLRRG
jgi:selenocysteine-specific elongation factor